MVFPFRSKFRSSLKRGKKKSLNIKKRKDFPCAVERLEVFICTRPEIIAYKTFLSQCMYIDTK